MYGEFNLLEEHGNTATIFGRSVVNRIYGTEVVNYVLTDDGKPSVNSKRTPMSIENVKLIKKAVKKRFQLDTNQLDRIWPKVRNSINGMGRFISYSVGVNRRLHALNSELTQLRAAATNAANIINNNASKE